MNKNIPDIKNFPLASLKNKLFNLGEKEFRAGQIYGWIYKKGINDFNRMSDLPEAFRNLLQQNFANYSLKPREILRSKDGSKKYLFELSDSSLIESVLIINGRRKTICISSQVGCKFGCAFCASGLVKFKRNLASSEIIGQVLSVKNDKNPEIDNYVFMGMGEPLDNLDNLVKSIEIMAEPAGLGISPRRITISTSGVAPAIEKLSNMGIKANLAVSLHATENKQRDALIPLNKKYPIQRLIEASNKYAQSSGRMTSIEYALIKDVNDTPEDARRLAEIAHKMHAKVNLITYNKMPEFKFHMTADISAKYFQYRLIHKKVRTTLRNSAGSDISAACGQLAYKGQR